MLSITFVLSSLSLLAAAAPHDRQARGIRVPLSKRSNITVDTSVVNAFALNTSIAAITAYVSARLLMIVC